MRPFETAPEITAPTTNVSLCVPFGAVTAAMPPPAAPGLRAGSSSSGRRASFSGRRAHCASCPPCRPPRVRASLWLLERVRRGRGVSSPRPVCRSRHPSRFWVGFGSLLFLLVLGNVSLPLGTSGDFRWTADVNLPRRPLLGASVFSRCSVAPFGASFTHSGSVLPFPVLPFSCVQRDQGSI